VWQHTGLYVVILALIAYNEANMNKVAAVVGMAGSGKSAVSSVFQDNGFVKIRFGDVTEREIKKRGLEVNEENERRIREEFRNRYGMEAYAILNFPEIDAAFKKADVVLDGLYSWEEYLFFKKKYGDLFRVVAVWSSPVTRYARLKQRPDRPLSEKEAESRDQSEIENLHKGGPIAMADFTIINESSLESLQSETEKVINSIRRN
jgi:dephospho-CoA kinase